MTATPRDLAFTSNGAPPPAGPYSHGIVIGDLLFTSGFGGHDPLTGHLPETIEEQTRQTLKNLASVLGKHNLTLDDVIKVTAHLQHVGRDFAGFNSAYEREFRAPYPVRTTVGSSLLNMLVEMDVVARMQHRQGPA